MKILSQLDDLNLDAAAKTQVAALIQSLLDQVKKDAETLQANDLKIQALILELGSSAAHSLWGKERSTVQYTE